jgi:serine/threonine protein kinase
MLNIKEGNLTYSTRTGPRIEHESIMFRRLDHPTIPAFVQLRPDMLVVGAVIGKPADSIVPRFSELPDPQKMHIYTSLLQGLHHIHTMFVVHGNINLKTIYISDRGLKPYYVDFTSSFLQGDSSPMADNGRFMAPETQRSGITTCKSDVYSLGMVFGSLFLCNAPDQWPADFALPTSTKVMLLADPRARGMSNTILHVLGQEEAVAHFRNPFFGSVQNALSAYDAHRIRGWTDLSAMDATQAWDVVMQPMLLFVSTYYDQLDPAVMNLIVTTLHRASALTMVHRISGDEPYLAAFARVNKAATLGFVLSCVAAGVIEVTEKLVTELLDDQNDDAMALISHLNMSSGAARIMAHVYAGSKRKADEALHATARASEVNQALAQMAAIAQTALGR